MHMIADMFEMNINIAGAYDCTQMHLNYLAQLSIQHRVNNMVEGGHHLVMFQFVLPKGKPTVK